jgi:hypothetical protein
VRSCWGWVCSVIIDLCVCGHAEVECAVWVLTCVCAAMLRLSVQCECWLLCVRPCWGWVCNVSVYMCMCAAMLRLSVQCECWLVSVRLCWGWVCNVSVDLCMCAAMLRLSVQCECWLVSVRLCWGWVCSVSVDLCVCGHAEVECAMWVLTFVCMSLRLITLSNCFISIASSPSGRTVADFDHDKRVVIPNKSFCKVRGKCHTMNARHYTAP